MTTYGSLFSGAGGFDLGCDAAGWECVWQVERDAVCRDVLAHRWPHANLYDDVRTVRGDQVAPIDVITFGFPCQDLSMAGKRAGLGGERSGLFFEVVRIIEEMRDNTDGVYPRVAIAENVVGLLNADNGVAMGRCLDALADIGAMGIEWRVLDARWFGVPQRRRRVFLVAVFDPRAAGAGQVFPEPAGHDRDHGEDDGIVGFYRTQGIYDIPCFDELPPLKAIAPCAIAGPAFGPRALTPTESEAAMGWPVGHTEVGRSGRTISDARRYRMCGNGVVAPVAKYVAESVERVLNAG